MESDKNLMLASRADDVLLSLKQWFSSLSQTKVDASKIQCNKSVSFGRWENSTEGEIQGNGELRPCLLQPILSHCSLQPLVCRNVSPPAQLLVEGVNGGNYVSNRMSTTEMILMHIPHQMLL